jgi:hypothetical protein
MARLEGKHGLPLEEIPGTVYVIHYAEPTIVLSVSGDYGVGVSERPVRHYVGWTQQVRPMNRVRNHHPPGTVIEVDFRDGTMLAEEQLKAYGTCAFCGEELADSLVDGAAEYYRRQ